MSNFHDSFVRLMRHEGGRVNNFRDPGGDTLWGLSRKTYPNLDFDKLTMNDAADIYRRDFWYPLDADNLPPEVAFNVFDAAVNSGITNAVKWLQRAVNEVDDGIMGPKTLLAARSISSHIIIARFNGHRLAFMCSLSTWDAFGKGWARRIANNLVES